MYIYMYIYIYIYIYINNLTSRQSKQESKRDSLMELTISPRVLGFTSFNLPFAYFLKRPIDCC